MDGNSTYSQAERKRACIVNGTSADAQSGPGTDVIEMGAVCYDMQKAEGAEPCASGGLGQAFASSGNKRERVDIISPEDLRANWDHVKHQQIGQALVNSGNKRESGGPNSTCGIKRERADIIESHEETIHDTSGSNMKRGTKRRMALKDPEDRPKVWDQMNQQQRRNYRIRHRKRD